MTAYIWRFFISLVVGMAAITACEIAQQVGVKGYESEMAMHIVVVFAQCSLFVCVVGIFREAAKTRG